MNDPLWEPEEGISNAAWGLFDEIYDQMEASGELGLGIDNSLSKDDEDNVDNDSGNGNE